MDPEIETCVSNTFKITKKDEPLSFSSKEPLGYILLYTGILCPFGVLPPTSEWAALGDSTKWKEVRISPPTIIWTPQDPLVCPAEFCKQEMKKNYSMEAHVKKHLILIMQERLLQMGSEPINCVLPDIRFKFCCKTSKCPYGYFNPAVDRYFSCLKYLKQHYFKVHAPKTFECDRCEKSFSTPGFLESHQRICGNSFKCSSCDLKYITLEALQTHSKRKDHSYDITKYKDIVSSSRQIKQAKKAEENTKRKLATVSLASIPIINGNDITRKKKHQLIIPKPKSIVVSEDGDTTEQVTWTYEGNQITVMKKQMGTQSFHDLFMTQQKIWTDKIFYRESAAESVADFSPVVNRGKRKKSAETQTIKVTMKKSTETQTATVTKRRRASKKQIAEAETQCTGTDPIINSSSTSQQISHPTLHESDNILVEPVSNKNEDNTFPCPMFMETPTPSSDVAAITEMPMEFTTNTCLETDNITEISIPFMTSMDEIYSTTNFQQGGFEFPSVANEITIGMETVGVGNSYGDSAQDLLNFGEFHQETQTDPSHFGSSELMLSNYNENLSIDEEVLREFDTATAETQTFTGASPPHLGFNLDSADSNSPFGPETYSTENLMNFSPIFEEPNRSWVEYNNGSSPNFLETMDNETQTPILHGEDGHSHDLFQSMINDLN